MSLKASILLASSIFNPLLYLSSQAHACEIAGDVALWATDACFWINETDDHSHPDMSTCLNRAQEHIAILGECDAKHLFKNAICAQAAKWQLNDDCLASDAPLGPALTAQPGPTLGQMQAPNIHK